MRQEIAGHFATNPVVGYRHKKILGLDPEKATLWLIDADEIPDLVRILDGNAAIILLGNALGVIAIVWFVWRWRRSPLVRRPPPPPVSLR